MEQSYAIWSECQYFFEIPTKISEKIGRNVDIFTTFRPDFCVGKFESAGKHLDKAVVASIYERFEAVTSYMHRILNVLYSRTEPGATCHVAMVDEAVAVTGAPFISRNKLLSASSASSALKGLLEKDFVTEDKNVYSLYDQFFALWLRYKRLI